MTLNDTAKQPFRTAARAASVAVVITTFDHARFLGDALASVFAQTVPPAEIIVVDDGSNDDPAAVCRQWDGVRLIRTENRGLAAARNTGLAVASSDFVLFLDADDVLASHAIEAHLECHEQHPGCGLVYGRHRRVDERLRPIEIPPDLSRDEPPYRTLLRYNCIGMHGAVLYQRTALAACGGFDQELRRCEDYDAYIRVARSHPIASHGGFVADYRIHADAMSSEPADMLGWALLVQDRHRPDGTDRRDMAAWREGRRRSRAIYARAAWRQRGPARWRRRRAVTARAPIASAASAAWRLVKPVLPAPVVRSILKAIGHKAPKVGTVDMGDLARVTPISLGWGAERGTPVDRWYIERFLAEHASDIRGRALEIAEPDYCRQFGTGITRQDILHVHADNPLATIVGDLTQPGVLPDGAFDCMIITQTLHLIYDMAAAVAHMKKGLAPGGVLLLTVPGVSSVCRGEWGECWYWSLTGASAKILFEREFGEGNVEIGVGGNVYGATAFLHGLALEEIDAKLLEKDDPAYPMVITVRARRDA